MSDLTGFRNHCRKMATADHKPDCPLLAWDRRGSWVAGINSAGPVRSVQWVPAPPKPECPGCNTTLERTLWTRLADEIDAYLAGPPEVVDLFGEATVEPEVGGRPDWVISELGGAQPSDPTDATDHRVPSFRRVSHIDFESEGS